jgi:hypothetical protein
MLSVQEVNCVLVMCVVHALKMLNAHHSLKHLIAMKVVDSVWNVKKTHNVLLN